MNNKRLTFYKDDNNNFSDDLDIDQFTFSQPHLFSINENINQNFQKLLIFHPQHEATLGFIKLDGTIKLENIPQIQHKTISKNKQNNQDPLQCSICDRKFQSPQAVGGHSSKSHPKESKKYQSKQIKKQNENMIFQELDNYKELQQMTQNLIDIHINLLQL